MSDFLTRLAERQLTAVPGVAPRLLPRFAPPAPVIVGVASPASTRPPVAGDEAATTQRVVLRVERDGPSEVSMTPIAAPEPSRVVPPMTPHPPSPAESVTHPHVHRVVDDRVLPVEASAPVPLVPAVHMPAGEAHGSAVALQEPRPVPSPRVEPPGMQSLVPRMPEATRPVQPPMPMPALPATPAAAPSPITVTIGRIEVRAVTPPPRREPTTVDRHTALSLKDYLDRRHGGRR